METEGSFSEAMRHRLVDEFVVSYYNGSMKPNLAEKNMATGREIEYLMDGPQFEKIRKSEIWSYSNAVGTGYQYRVIYRDKRYSDLEPLLQMYTGTVPVQDGDKSTVEQKLYELVLQMIKEGRLPKSFRIQTTKEVQDVKVAEMLNEMERSLEELGGRVRKLEEQLSAQSSAKTENGLRPFVIPTIDPTSQS